MNFRKIHLKKVFGNLSILNVCVIKQYLSIFPLSDVKTKTCLRFWRKLFSCRKIKSSKSETGGWFLSAKSDVKEISHCPQLGIAELTLSQYGTAELRRYSGTKWPWSKTDICQLWTVSKISNAVGPTPTSPMLFSNSLASLKWRRVPVILAQNWRRFFRTRGSQILHCQLDDAFRRYSSTHWKDLDLPSLRIAFASGHVWEKKIW